MQTKYMFEVDEDGRIVSGTTVRYPDSYNAEGTEAVWDAQERAVYDAAADTWTIYDPLTIDAPLSAVVDEEITVTVTLPEDSPDDEVTVAVTHNGEEIASTTLPVTDRQASQSFVFDVPGMYIITASSSHHGSASAGVAVNE